MLSLTALLSWCLLALQLNAQAQTAQPETTTPAAVRPAHVALLNLAESAQADWAGLFAASGMDYELARVVADLAPNEPWCGQLGPWHGLAYCPADSAMFVDSRLLDALPNEDSRQADLAKAYLLAHALGHHVQNLLGVTHKVAKWDVAMSRRLRQDLHHRTELQADCFAGLWFRRSSLAPQLLRGQNLRAMFDALAEASEALHKRDTVVQGELFRASDAGLRAKWFSRGMRADGVEDCDTYIDERL